MKVNLSFMKSLYDPHISRIKKYWSNFGEKMEISNTRTSKKKRGHRNGNIKKLLKSGEL
jgi:hypothetical protein